MKLRHGFVSNSSSSSYCIFGVMADVYSAAKALGVSLPEETSEPGCECKVDRTQGKFCPQCGKPLLVTYKYTKSDLQEFVESKCREIGWCMESDGYEWYIGLDLKPKRPSEDLIAAMQEAAKEIREKFGKEPVVHSIVYYS